MQSHLLTPTQFLIVQKLFDGPRTIEELRRGLNSHGLASYGSACWRVVARMVKRRYVYGQRVHPTDRDECPWPRRYQVTDVGLYAWHCTREFFAQAALPRPELVPYATQALAENERRARLDREKWRGELKQKLMKHVMESLSKERRKPG